MDLEKLIKFEPIDLTQILLTVIVVTIVIWAFKAQLNGFFDSLKDRPISVKMSASETTIKLDAPVVPELLTEAVSNPDGNEQEINEWEQTVEYIDNIDGFAKLGFGDLYEKLTALGENEFAVINFAVNDPSKFYFNDESMLKYLSIASEKVRYLAFYDNSQFAAAIRIQYVIAGLASKNYDFESFGEKIKSGAWEQFPGLVSEDSSLDKTPSVKELQQFLSTSGLSEVPYIQNNKLVGFLNYKSISTELYSQASN
jgi:hypothetical protein